MTTVSHRAAEAAQLINSAPLHIMRGENSEALNAYDAALRIGEEIGSLEVQTVCHSGRANVLDGMGRLPEAVLAARKSIELGKKRSTAEMIAARCRAHVFLAISLAKLREFKEARTQAEEAGRLCENLNNDAERMGHFVALAEIYGTTGDLDEQENALSKAIEMAQAVKNFLVESATTFMLGKLLLQRMPSATPSQRIETLLSGSVQMLAKIKRDGASAQARLFLARYYRRIGNKRLAQEHYLLTAQGFRDSKAGDGSAVEREMAEMMRG